MPGRKCVLCGKSSLVTSREVCKTSYFSFPKDENLRKKWTDVCHNKIDNIINVKICSDHFKEEDFLHQKHGTEEVRKKRLKSNAVPSLYLGAKGEKQSRNNANTKNSNKEILKDSSKKRDSSGNAENVKYQNSVLQAKKRNSSVNKNYKSIRVQFKNKSISEKNKITNKTSKGVNKENTKELIKKKSSLKNTSLVIKEASKKNIDKELVKKKKVSFNIISVKKDQIKHKIIKKSINKENQMGTVEDGFNNPSTKALKVTPKEKLTGPTVTKSNKKQLNKKKNHQEINSTEESKTVTNIDSPKELPKHEISDYNEKEICGKEIFETKDSFESNAGNALTKKTVKRKSSMGNELPRKAHKKRIRLGKDDSEDSEESSSEFRITNSVSREKITYKSASEMAENADLLKYLNYLKEKSRSSDQPILFWVDN